ncbi:MAG: type I restriction-modification enzyme R subunit C-terminal domain-containing protein [Pirellulaceae bacterium]
MQKIIDAEKSDLFDVLAHVAYAMVPLTREERADRAQVVIGQRFSSQQQAFLTFVLAHYVSVGVEELDRDKLTPLLRLKYHDSIADTIAELGRPEEIGQVFAGFQRYLCEKQVAASPSRRTAASPPSILARNRQRSKSGPQQGSHRKSEVFRSS